MVLMKIERKIYVSLVCSALLILLSACIPATLVAPKPTELPKPSPITMQTSTATHSPPALLPPTQTPTRPASPEGSYAVAGIEPDDVLQLREGPGLTTAVIGTIPAYGTDIKMTAPVETLGEEQWAPVVYQGQSGWVNATFLAAQSGTPPPGLARTATQAIQFLKQRDFAQLAAFVPPAGLRFSPHSFVRPEDMQFTPQQVADLMNNPQVFHWGAFDGSGAPIEMVFTDYYQRFLYDVDFAQADAIGFNANIGGGSMINNIADFYPGAAVVEYHFPGFNPDYGGMDWRSLRLVFMPGDQGWVLVGIVHDEWGP
jgi:hypothetical protein